MDLLSLINQHKNKIVNIIVATVLLMVSYNIYNTQARALELLRQKKDSAIKKNQVLNDISGLEKELDVYKQFLNGKDMPSIINRIGDIAEKSGVDITSVVPQKEIQEFPAYIKYFFTLTVNADNYHAIARFISNLESNPDVYILETTTIRPDKRVARVSKMSADLKISTVLYKD